MASSRKVNRSPVTAHATKSTTSTSECCDAEITETGFCSDCWEHAA